MEWWKKMILPVKSVCTGVAARLGFRKSGILMLRREVKACDYKDVHMMWEMLKGTEIEIDRSHVKRPFWNILEWARSAPCLGRTF